MASAALTESFTLLPFKPSTACRWRFELPSRPPPGRRSGSRGIVLSLGILVSAKRSVNRKGSKGDCGAPAKVRSIVQETDFQPDGKSDPWRTKQQGRFVVAASDEEDMPLTAVDEACRRPGGRGGLSVLRRRSAGDLDTKAGGSTAEASGGVRARRRSAPASINPGVQMRAGADCPLASLRS
jgi:hypothetical protein